MKRSKLLLFMLIIPWLTIPFLGMNTFKKFLPSALFCSTVTKALDMFGEKKRWWHFYKGLGQLNSMDFFNLGNYFVMTLWVLKLSHGKFPLFLIINGIPHVLFTFLGLKYLKQHKIASLVNMGRFQYLVLITFRGLLLYGFQMLIDLKKENGKEQVIPNKGGNCREQL